VPQIVAEQLRHIVGEHLAPDTPLARALTALADHSQRTEQRLAALEAEVLPRQADDWQGA
jgi:hypothetical protein